jgi:hypothetical protein
MTDFTELSGQPFLISLERAAEQQDDYAGYEVLLKTQQGEFLTYVQTRSEAEASAPKRFQFLKTLECKLDIIKDDYEESVKKRNIDFYRFWIHIITNTRHFATIGVETLKFQANCPAYMVAEPDKTHKLPHCRWEANDSDLMELIVGIFRVDAIKLEDGSRPSFANFAKLMGDVFGIDFTNPHAEMKRILERKKDNAPFLKRMIENLENKSEKEIKKKNGKSKK